MAELDKGLFSSVGETPVDVDMLDFAYVEECQDWKKLFSVLEVLKSGKEGFYPELMKATEDKLLSTMPDKERRKYLALKSTASAEEVASASEDIRQWQASSMSIDAQLKTGQMQNLGHHNSGGISTNEVFSQISRVQREKIEEAGRKLKVAELTEFQKERRAELERRKGNESFKASEYEASIRFYTISIALHPLNDSVWANRAIAHIKLKLFDLAEQDCNACLMLNKSNVKGLARRGFARFSQGKYSAAALDYHAAMKLDQSNEEYPKFLAKAKEMYLASEGKELVIESHEKVLEKVEPVRIVHSNTSGTWISERCIAVGSLSELVIPSESVKLLSTGRVVFRTMDFEPEDSYVRIPVSIDDEAEDINPHDTKSSNEEEFVRISIEEDDETDDDDEGSQLSPLEQAASIEVAMSAEEKASALKEYGNKLMVSGQFLTAEEAYSLSLHYEFSIPTVNNRAQAKLSAQNFLGAIEDANSVLEVETQNIKALYRRAKAFQELGMFAESKADLDNILRTDPANPPALKMISQVSAMLRKAEDEKRKSRADELKVQGNRVFQEGNVESALSLYTEAIQLDPDNLSIYNNRALAYLASNSYVDVISDCTRVIDGLVGKDGVDSVMLRKAYHRRAEASFRIQPRTEGTCSDALRDATEAYNLQSDNPIVAELLTSIRDAMKQLVSSNHPPIAPFESGTKSQSSTPMKGASEKSPKTPSSASRSKIDVKVEAPTVAAKTLYEFERTWRGLAGQHTLRVAYLKLFKSANFKKVFKAAISDDLLESLFEALASDDADSDLSIRVLEALKQMNSFALTIRMLPESALISLKNIFLKLATSDVEKVSTLRSDYNL